MNDISTLHNVNICKLSASFNCRPQEREREREREREGGMQGKKGVIALLKGIIFQTRHLCTKKDRISFEWPSKIINITYPSSDLSRFFIGLENQTSEVPVPSPTPPPKQDPTVYLDRRGKII